MSMDSPLVALVVSVTSALIASLIQQVILGPRLKPQQSEEWVIPQQPITQGGALLADLRRTFSDAAGALSLVLLLWTFFLSLYTGLILGSAWFPVDISMDWPELKWVTLKGVWLLALVLHGLLVGFLMWFSGVSYRTRWLWHVVVTLSGVLSGVFAYAASFVVCLGIGLLLLAAVGAAEGAKQANK